MTDQTKLPHRRFNPLTGEWLLVSPQRTLRPWQGKSEQVSPPRRPSHDPQCYLCPGNRRAGGATNPEYTETFVFTNDFAALLPSQEPTGLPKPGSDALFCYQPVRGTCRVICFSPRHDMSLAEMSPDAIGKVIDVWAEETAELAQQYRWVQVFENKGDVMGCSNPHPHGQIWASDFLPNEAVREQRQQSNYYQTHGSVLLLDYVQRELEQRERVVAENESWLVVVPFWALWPFETLLLPRRPVQWLPDLSIIERQQLAEILRCLLIRYDNLFETSFPYSMGWHGAPTDARDDPAFQLHAHFYPPLLRSATVKKFMVGYEMLAEAQRDLTAEQAAQRLVELPETHYRERASAT